MYLSRRSVGDRSKGTLENEKERKKTPIERVRARGTGVLVGHRDSIGRKVKSEFRFDVTRTLVSVTRGLSEDGCPERRLRYLVSRYSTP